MLPFRDIQLLTIGGAAVIDTALLLVLFERRNWRRIVLPIVLLLLGAWLLHAGAFVRTLVLDTPGRWADHTHAITTIAMSVGMILMPAAMLHAIIRLRYTGLRTAPANPLFALPYLPLLALIPAIAMLWADPRAPMLASLESFVWPYLLWLTCVNLYAAHGFLTHRHAFDLPGGGRFFTALAGALIILTACQFTALALAIPQFPQHAEQWQLALVLSPLILVLLFAYFILRYNFMQLVLERTLVYGVIVLGVVMGHRFLLRDFLTRWEEQFHFDFAFVEAAALALLILAYRPLRQRTAEGLRYLMGERVHALRHEMSDLSKRMTQLSVDSPRQTLHWFHESLKRTLDMERMQIHLFTTAERPPMSIGDAPLLDSSDAMALQQAMKGEGLIACRRSDAPTGTIDEHLGKADANLAVVIDHLDHQGVALLGRRRRHRVFTDEQVGMVILLVEQLGVALANGLLQSQRLAAERRALQAEKLSTLGLLAGSIAHEVKNPLSSIRTIATLLAEDLHDTPHAHDLSLITGEIDRLAATVTRLLQFSRPADDASPASSMTHALECTLAVLKHLAKEQGVVIHHQAPADLPPVKVRDSVQREILFNLIKNGIEAAGPGGQVTISVATDGSQATLTVQDNGPGLAPQIEAGLFEPFATTKPQGTGLGLYIVARHVREAGGEIRCESDTARGARFIVRLPHIGSVAPDHPPST